MLKLVQLYNLWGVIHVFSFIIISVQNVHGGEVGKGRPKFDLFFFSFKI